MRGRIEELPIGTGMDDAKLFISSERKSSFNRGYCNRIVFNGRRVDLSDFGDSDITAMIEAVGWTPIICMDHPIFPRLVRLFYCNLEFDRDRPSVTSLVNGTPIHLTCDSLSAMLGIPNEGVKRHKSKGWESDDGGHILDALRLVCGDDTIAARSRPHFRSLPPRNRVLHNMVMSMFLPRGCSRERVSRTDLFLLKKILSGERANLPYMIIHHMIDSVSNKYFPYGMLLTKIFELCSVDISGDDFCERLKWKEVYNSQSLLREGYVLTEAGWKPKEAPGDLDGEAMEDREEEEATVTMEEELKEEEELKAMHEGREKKQEDQPAIILVTDVVLGDLLSNGSKSSIYKVDDIHESLNQLSSRVDTLALSLEKLRCQQEQGFATLTGKLDILMDFLNHHFWPYPPPPPPFAG